MFSKIDSLSQGDMNLTFKEKFQKGEHELAMVLRRIYSLAQSLKNLEKVKVLESLMMEKSNWYEFMLDSMNEPVSVTDMDKNVTFINKAGLDVLGKTREEVVGKYCGDVWGVDICKDHRCCIECMKGGEGKSYFQVGNQKFTTLASYLKDVHGNNIGHLEVVNNITEEEKFIEESRNQMLKLDMTMDAANIGLWDMLIVQGDPVNPNNAFTWSDSFKKLLGYSNEAEFPNIFSSWSDKLHPEDKERTINAFAAHIIDRTEKTPYDIEYRLLKKNGEYGYFQAFGETIRDKEGYAIRVAGGIKDVTKEKMLMEEAYISAMQIKEEKNFYESTLDAPPNTMLYVADLNKKVTYMNSGCLKALGKTKEEVIGKYCYDVWNVEICKTDRCAIECLKCGIPGAIEFSLGDSRLTTQANCVNDLEGNPIGYIEVIEDITDRHKQDKALQDKAYEMQQFHAAVFDSCNIVMFSDEGIITDVNEKLLPYYMASASQNLSEGTCRNLLVRNVIKQRGDTLRMANPTKKLNPSTRAAEEYKTSTINIFQYATEMENCGGFY